VHDAGNIARGARVIYIYIYIGFEVFEANTQTRIYREFS
jgi:hypothetical protein